ncbi:MAG: isochorismatase family cysteine hydrolase [Candidatus Moraniibacteriota bacterium]
MKPYLKMNSENTALLIIDVVNSCCHENSEDPEIGICYSKIRKMIPRLAKFIDIFKKKIKSQVIFVKIDPWTKKCLSPNVIELYDNDPSACYYSDDETGFSEEFYLVKPEKEDLVITKNNYDAFANRDLEKILKEKNIQYLLVTGVFTDGCVLATVCGGFQKGFNFIILKDLVETTDVKKRQNLQKHLIDYTFPMLYGKTVTSKDFLDNWDE